MGTPRSESAKLTLRSVEVFVAVAEAGALGTAAARLGASPSSVSQQVTNLEAALGARLIDRVARPFALTPAGQLFLARAHVILGEAAAARTELAALGHADLPALGIALVEELDSEVTPALAQALARKLPRCRITCRTGPSHENFEALTARSVDLAVSGEVDDLPADLEHHPLMRDPFVLVTARGLLGGDADPLTVLSRAPLVALAPEQLMQRQIIAQFRRLKIDIAPRFVFDTNHAIMATVAGVRGWTVSTPLGFLRVPRLHARIEMRPLPFRGFARSLSLYARRGVLGGLPAETAALLRSLIEEEAVQPARRSAPWLGQGIRLLEPVGAAAPASPDASSQASTGADGVPDDAGERMR
ncbi:MAG: LysR family transcriptional regulator [Pseudomonadota bacterium]